jgi:hypothetical protein
VSTGPVLGKILNSMLDTKFPNTKKYFIKIEIFHAKQLTDNIVVDYINSMILNKEIDPKNKHTLKVNGVYKVKQNTATNITLLKDPPEYMKLLAIVYDYVEGLSLTDISDKPLTSLGRPNMIRAFKDLFKFICKSTMLHNDLHSNNIMYDSDKKKFIVIDYGRCDFDHNNDEAIQNYIKPLSVALTLFKTDNYDVIKQQLDSRIWSTVDKTHIKKYGYLFDMMTLASGTYYRMQRNFPNEYFPLTEVLKFVTTYDDKEFIIECPAKLNPLPIKYEAGNPIHALCSILEPGVRMLAIFLKIKPEASLPTGTGTATSSQRFDLKKVRTKSDDYDDQPNDLIGHFHLANYKYEYPFEECIAEFNLLSCDKVHNLFVNICEGKNYKNLKTETFKSEVAERLGYRSYVIKPATLLADRDTKDNEQMKKSARNKKWSIDLKPETYRKKQLDNLIPKFNKKFKKIGVNLELDPKLIIGVRAEYKTIMKIIESNILDKTTPATPSAEVTRSILSMFDGNIEQRTTSLHMSSQYKNNNKKK